MQSRKWSAQTRWTPVS